MFYKLTSSISLCVVIIYLFIVDKLILYVHPRYEIFSVALSIIGASLLILSFFNFNKHNNEKLKLSDFLVIFLALIALTFPPLSLSEKTAENRLQSSNVSLKNTSISSYDSFSQDFTHFDIVDWSSLLSSQPPIEQIVGKSAKVTGFIFMDSNNNRYISRFKLSCCAVDATPITIRLSENDLSRPFIEGEWRQIEGKLIFEDGNFKLSVESAVSIPEPEQPYVY